MQKPFQSSFRVTRPPIIRPTMSDIAWAAGIYEGEGSCYATGVNKFNVVVQVNQRRRWILDRLAERFGGYVYLDKWQRGEQYRWNISGSQARGFLMTIYPFLSPHRRLQIWRALWYEVCAMAEEEINSKEVASSSRASG